MTNLPTPATRPDTTAAYLPLQQADLEELDNILDDLRTRFDEVPQWEFCEGFIAALVCCRREISASDYFAVLLDLDGDSGSPLFADEAQFKRFFELWMRRYQQVTLALSADIKTLEDERAYLPDLLDMRGAVADLSPEERADMGDEPVPSYAQIWAIGFMYAVESWPEEWAPPRDKKAAQLIDAALQAIITVTEDDTVPATLPAFINDKGDKEFPSMSQQRLDDLAVAIWAIYDLHALWESIGPRIDTVHVGPKVVRNDPCPCGSGKKFKKCCGA